MTAIGLVGILSPVRLGPVTLLARNLPWLLWLLILRETPMALAYGPVAVMVTFGVILGVASLVIAWLLRPHDAYPEKLETYECGVSPIGEAWGQFFVRYYLIALVFVVFDVEALFLFPWATIFKRLTALPGQGSMALLEMAIFIAILLVGLAYVWRKGDLEWTR